MITMTEEESQAERLTKENMRVFKVNDCDWVAAPDKLAAVSWYRRQSIAGGQISELDDVVSKHVPECSLDDEMFVEMGAPERGMTTYRKVIGQYLDAGNTEPFVVASTEY